MERLQKRGVNCNLATRLEDAEDFSRYPFRIAQVFENIKSENAIENIIAKWKVMRITDDIRVAKDFVLELNAVWITHRRRTSPDVQNKFLSFAQDTLVLGAGRIADVLRRDDFDWHREENHSVLADGERSRAVVAKEIFTMPDEPAATIRTY